MESRFRKKQTSIVLDYEELDDTENFFPKNLNSNNYIVNVFIFIFLGLELNFSSGATKNIFESIKKTLSSDYSKLLPKAFLVENKKASKQDYFKKEINLKFINHLNETKLKKKCDISPRDSNNISSIPTINIIPTVEKMAKTELNYDKNMLFINEESQSPRKKKNEKKCSPDPRSISWIYHEFSNIIFNRNESNETFLSHLLLTYKGLVQSKEYFNKQEKTNQLQQKIVKLFSKNSFFF